MYDFTPLSPQMILLLYQMMKDIHDLFVQTHIPYWMDGGTLLGALRHTGIIPWDDDLDIGVLEEYVPAIESLQSVLLKLGYGLASVDFGYKIFPLTGEPYQDQPFNFPFLDIYCMHQRDMHISYRQDQWGKRDDKPMFIAMHELYPLTLYPFGEFLVYGPAHPHAYVSALYGKEWATKGTLYNHSTHVHGDESILLSSDTLAPAQPTGPLINRVDHLVL